MPTDPGILNIQLMFKALSGPGAASNLPPMLSLSRGLQKIVDRNTSTTYSVDKAIIGKFATASVEAWQRGLHSFLMSASLTTASPIWSSVAGYYSSHYTMRAFAHLLGFFQLFNLKKIIKLDLAGNGYAIDVISRNAGDREHRVYWRLVHESTFFRSDPFFYHNDDAPPPPGTMQDFISDGGHRNRANYGDHIGLFPVFTPLNDTDLELRLDKLSKIEINDPPRPNVDRFPDIDNVQLIAYHRILKYRAFLDEILSTSKGFWAKQRDPSWKPAYFDFQATGVNYSGFLSDMTA